MNGIFLKIVRMAKTVSYYDCFYFHNDPMLILLFYKDAFEIGESPNLAFAGPFTLEGCSGGGFSSSGAAASGASGSAGAAPSGSSGSSPAASGSSSGATPASSSSSHSGSSSSPASAEGAAGQVLPGAAVAVMGGLAAVYQLF